MGGGSLFSSFGVLGDLGGLRGLCFQDTRCLRTAKDV